MALRRALELKRPVLYLVAVEPGLYEPIIPCYVVGDDASQLAFYLMADGRRDVTAIVEDPLQSPSKAYTTRIVNIYVTRSASGISYSQPTGVSVRFAGFATSHSSMPPTFCRIEMEACNPEIPNGLALCRIHHGSYDFGILGVDADYRVHIRQDVLEEHDGPMLQHGLQELHGNVIQVPRRPEHLPNREYLAERFSRFQAA